jgi:hypothetical protein
MSVLLACRVLQGLLEPHLPDATTTTFFDYGLHMRPSEMRPTLQERLDALPEPETVIIGYGLCGNGVVGLEAGPHTLVMPRTHDCIAMMLGSREAYEKEFAANPATYYLTLGWLQTGDDPLGEYHRLVAQYGPERAGDLIDTIYGSYRRLCVIAFSPEEMEETRRLAAPVADFCRSRWGATCEERIGDPGLIVRLAAFRPDEVDPDLLVIPPGGTVTQEMFLTE